MAKAGKKNVRLKQENELQSFRSLDESIRFDSYDELESFYMKETAPEYRKKYAQFFTPKPLAEMMCKWVAKANPEKILDPAVGLGVFASEFRKINPSIQVVAHDVDPWVLQCAAKLNEGSYIEFKNSDFLLCEDDSTYKGIVANPPYLRHHDFSYSGDIFSEIGKRNGVKLSKTINLYGLFVFEICRRLEFGGRAAIIIPTDWANSNFGEPLRKYLLDSGCLVYILYFSPENQQFSDALTTACILFIEKPSNNKPRESVDCVYVRGLLGTKEIEELIAGAEAEKVDAQVSRIPVSRLLVSDRWEYLIREGMVEDHCSAVPLSVFATTKRGIATGANSFFWISRSEAQDNEISPAHLQKCVGRANDAIGLIFSDDDFDELKENGSSCYLVNFDENLSAGEKEYLQMGVNQGLPDRHLLSVRKTWYRMEKRTVAPIWATVQSRSGLKFVRNSAGVMNLTAFHGIYPYEQRPVFLDALTVVLNSEPVKEMLEREVRSYGGGMKKIQPDDLLRVQVPSLQHLSDSELVDIAQYLTRMDSDFRNGMRTPEAVNSLVSRLFQRNIDKRTSLGSQVELF